LCKANSTRYFLAWQKHFQSSTGLLVVSEIIAKNILENNNGVDLYYQISKHKMKASVIKTMCFNTRSE
jgi:hypothetical protein